MQSRSCGSRALRVATVLTLLFGAALAVLAGGKSACPAACAGDASETPLLTSYIFAPPGCVECETLEKDVIPRVREQYGEVVRCVLVPVEGDRNLRLQFLYEKWYGIRSDEAVKAFVGTRCMIGVKAIQRNIEGVIEKELLKGVDSPTPEEILASAKGDAVTNRFAAFTPAAVAVAGLFDGINPCAFVTLVFFLSVLAMLKKERREILIVGIAFTATVFATYLLIGIALFKAIKGLSVSLGISSVIAWATACFALVMCVFSMADAVRFRRSSDAGDISLKLPDGIRKTINRLIRERMKTGHIAVSAAALGFAVTLLEAMCTGQIYLPVIVDVIRRKGLLTDALPLLILYNVMFVLPVLAVFAAAYAGTSSQRISAFFSRRVVLSKVLMATVFFFLGICLLAGGSTGG